MIAATELKGILGMMPAFATPDATDIRATQTIAVDNLKEPFLQTFLPLFCLPRPLISGEL